MGEPLNSAPWAQAMEQGRDRTCPVRSSFQPLALVLPCVHPTVGMSILAPPYNDSFLRTNLPKNRPEVRAHRHHHEYGSEQQLRCWDIKACLKT